MILVFVWVLLSTIFFATLRVFSSLIVPALDSLCLIGKHDIQVAALGAICWSGKTRLVFIPSCTSVTANVYLNMMKDFIMPDLAVFFPDQDYEWQQVPPLSFFFFPFFGDFFFCFFFSLIVSVYSCDFWSKFTRTTHLRTLRASFSTGWTLKAFFTATTGPPTALTST